MKILLVEDERDLSQAIKRVLGFQKYDVDTAFDGLTGLEMATSNNYDLVVLDIMLPKLNGFDFVKKIRIPETAGASYQDFPFMAEVFCRAKRVSVVKRPFVHWRNDEGQGNSTSARGEKLLLMARNSKTAIEILKKYKKFDIYKEPFFVHVLWTNYEFFNRIDWKYKKQYYNELVDIFSEIRDDPEFHFVYFSTFENNSVRYFLEKNGYKKYIRKKFIHDTKTKMINVATALLPTYRMSRFLKDQNFDIMRQNELLMDEVLALRKELEKGKK